LGVLTPERREKNSLGARNNHMKPKKKKNSSVEKSFRFHVTCEGRLRIFGSEKKPGGQQKGLREKEKEKGSHFARHDEQ